MQNIVTVKWGTKYGSEYVNKLHNMISRTARVPFNITCFTDDPVGILSGIKILPLNNDLPIWWNKVYLFCEQNGLRPGEQYLYLDLDTLITGDISPLIEYDGDFLILRDFGVVKEPDSFRGYESRFGSAIMSWKHGVWSGLWEAFDSHKDMWMRTCEGDQNFLEQVLDHRAVDIVQEKWPGWARSYKYECYHEVPKDTRIVCFHGKPSIPEAISEPVIVYGELFNPRKWVEETWK